MVPVMKLKITLLYLQEVLLSKSLYKIGHTVHTVHPSYAIQGEEIVEWILPGRANLSNSTVTLSIAFQLNGNGIHCFPTQR